MDELNTGKYKMCHVKILFKFTFDEIIKIKYILVNDK